MNDRPSLARLAGRPLLKMNGIGNAIAVLDVRGSDMVVTADEARAIAALPGLHFDQLMTIHDATTPRTDASIRIYNVDGSPSAACGNGTRCVAWYLLRGRPDDHLVLTSAAGRLDCRREGPWQFSVDLGAPILDWANIPLAEDRDPAALDLGTSLGNAFAVGLGNPHAVFFVADTEAIDLAVVGPPLEQDPIFPERANISFAQVLDRGRIKLRVWERGAGATLACGTGACATLVAAAATGRTERQALVELPGGTLAIDWRADDHVLMSGPVALELETRVAVPVAEPAS